jgi:hypothetical protein
MKDTCRARHAAHNGNVKIRDIRKFVRVVWLGRNGFTEVFANFARIHVDTQRELDIPNMISLQPGVHNAWDSRVVVFIELDSLPCTSDEAQFPTPMMATRTFLFGIADSPY